MKKFGCHIVLCFLTAILSIPLSAQQTKRSSGSAQVRVEDNMTKEQARRKAEELAKIDAIINAFGQYVEQETNLSVQDGRLNFNIIGTTRVKGEWVRELSKAFEEESRDEKGTFGTIQTQWITCKIRGMVKEASPKANIEYYTLSYPNPVSKAQTFISGNSFYVWFRSPVNGYLSIYLDDGTDVFRLLPYDDMPSLSTVKIDADNEYIFFSRHHNYFSNNVDELILFTPKKSELNTLHFIFSEEQYFKPVLESTYKDEKGDIAPKSLSKTAFENWLAKNKIIISDFLDAQVYIEILRE